MNVKPHSDFAGHTCERRNQYSGGHTIILDCKRAQDEGTALVEDYREEGGRYQVLCNSHSTVIYSPNLPKAREMMKDATIFCLICRDIAGEGDGEALKQFRQDQAAGLFDQSPKENDGVK